MKNKNIIPAVVMVVAVVIAALVAWTGAQGAARVRGWQLLWVCAWLAFVIQWAAFVPAYLLRTEKFYDLVGSFTFLVLLAMTAHFGPPRSKANTLLLVFCGVWALRLGAYLFLRVHRDGADRRFARIKTSFMQFGMSWTLQGLWVFLTLCPVIIVVGSAQWHHASIWTAIGAALWVFGFGIEIVSDWQKSQFKASSGNAGQFIRTGLWAWSRHPNYAGEILLWTGIFVICAPMLEGLQWVAAISPLFTLLLLTKVSGVPMLEASADARWGSTPEYAGYKKRTPVLWPWGRRG